VTTAAGGQIRAMADSYVNPEGEFDRDSRYIPTRITADGRDGFPVEPGRYRLVVSRACPWANRAIIVRRLLGLEPVLSMGIAGPTHDERSWQFDLDPGGRDPVLGIERLQEAFLARFPDYDKGITVPPSSTSPPARLSPTTSPGSPSTCRPSGRPTTATAHRTSTRSTCATRWTP
jgi:putative glutathione S-transferase